MAVNATMAVTPGVAATLIYDNNGVPITTWTYTYGTRRVSALAILTPVTFTPIDYLEAVDQLRRWLAVARVTFPSSPSLKDGEWLLKWERNQSPLKIKMRGERGVMFWSSSWKASTNEVEVDPRPALDLSVDEFVSLFVEAHERLGKLALAG